MSSSSREYHVIISGCSGGGKSTLLLELSQRGYRTVQEPGRRIVGEELATGGRALPWIDLAAFARRAMEVASDDRRAVTGVTELVFFDRGIIDAAVALEHATGEPAAKSLKGAPRFNRTVFMTPPWPEIYDTDDERQLDLDDGVDEYNRLIDAYDRLGYETTVLPKTSVQRRADQVLEMLS